MAEPVPDARELRDFLKANATVVAPGETLVIRAPDLTPMQMREVMDVLNAADPDGTPWLPFRTVVVPGDGFGVVKPGELREALRDVVQEEVFRQRTARAAFMKDVRIDVFRDGAGATWRLAHLPTGITAEGPDEDGALAKLATELAAQGKIAVNEARKALGLPVWLVPEFGEAREIP